MWQFDPQRVLENVHAAATEDLLDRATAYRAGMEPQALAMIELELELRGVTPAEIAEREERYRATCLYDQDGVALMCSFCRQPAVKEGWGLHRLLRLLPLLPRRYRYCQEHVPQTRTAHSKDVTPADD